jgi:hypothetical protein
MVDFPHPETPMTISTAGARGEAPSVVGESMDINSLLMLPRRDP